MLTPYQQLAKVHSHTGVRIQLGLFEELAMCEIKESSVEIWINTAHVTTSGTRHRITRRGYKIVRMTVRTGGRWGYDTPEVVWFNEGAPVLVVGDQPHTLAHEREQWENLCHRPGTPNWPLDSQARRDQGC